MTLRPGRLAAVLVVLLILRLDGGAQQPGVLHITVSVAEAGQQAKPVPRHALLISDNPATAVPRRVLTALDGTADVRLPAGNYTVESDQPLILHGKSYQWTQTLDIAPGRDARLELTAANAQIEAVSPASSAADAPASASGLLIDWQNSLVSIWTPTRLGAGFLIDARGLIATNQRLIGGATIVEVQLSPEVKIAGRVLVSDPDRNVAILWVDPAAVRSARPVRLGYLAAGATPRLSEKAPVFAINAPVNDEKSLASGKVTRAGEHTIVTDVAVDADSLGGPLFDAAGDVIAISTPEESTSGASSEGSRAVPIEQARKVIADAEKKMQNAEPPKGTPLPVEPRQPFPDEGLKEAARRRVGSTSAYRIAAADFDVSIITPLLIYAAQHQGDVVGGGGRGRGREERDPLQMQEALRAVQDFGNWSDYVRGYPPVVLIRATPKLVEGFWKSIARGAAQSQGVSLPAIKHVKAGFSRMRLYCNEAEVTPIHPFTLEHRVGDSDAVYEGLYVFDPAAMGPQCGTMKLVLFSDKAPDTGDTRLIDPRILQQIRSDFSAAGWGQLHNSTTPQVRKAQSTSRHATPRTPNGQPLIAQLRLPRLIWDVGPYVGTWELGGDRALWGCACGSCPYSA